MLEKAARALFDSYVRLSGMDDAEAEPYWLAQKEGFVLSARAALEAIREIGPDIMLRVQWGRVPDRIQAYWADTITAILEEKPE